MSKKTFTGGFNTLLGDTKRNKPAQDEPKPQPVKRTEITKSTQEGTYKGEIRATFIIKEDKLETLKALAFWERKKIKDLINECIDLYIQSKEKSLIDKANLEFKKLK